MFISIFALFLFFLFIYFFFYFAKNGINLGARKIDFNCRFSLLDENRMDGRYTRQLALPVSSF